MVVLGLAVDVGWEGDVDAEEGLGEVDKEVEVLGLVVVVVDVPGLTGKTRVNEADVVELVVSGMVMISSVVDVLEPSVIEASVVLATFQVLSSLATKLQMAANK